MTIKDFHNDNDGESLMTDEKENLKCILGKK
jgi:hypothetical protein